MPDATSDPEVAALAETLAGLDNEALAAVRRMLAAADRAAPEPLVRARRFELVDDYGRVRAVVGDVDPSGGESYAPGFALYSDEGKERVALFLGVCGPSFAMDMAGNDALLMGVRDPDSPAWTPGPFLTL